LPGIFLISAGFTGCNRNATVGLVVGAVGLSGLAMSGYGVNHLDLAPTYAGWYYDDHLHLVLPMS